MKSNTIFPRLVGILILASLLLAACTSPAATSEETTPEITLTDALGRTVTLPEPPTRIVLAGRGVVLIADAVYLFPEAVGRVAATSTISQSGGDPFLAAVDPDFASKVLFETNVGAEQLAAAKPDLVILKSYLQESLGAPLEALNIPVVYLDLETPEQYTRDLAVLGIIFQNQARADELIAFYQDTAAGVSSAVREISSDQKPRILLLYYTDRDGEVAFNVPPASWIQTMMVEMAGGSPVWNDIELGGGWTKVGFEQIAAWDADQIIIIRYTGSPLETVRQLKSDPQWKELRAVQEDRLSAFPKDYISWDQSDARWILGLQWLAAQIYPQAFPNYEVTTSARDFFQQWYGLDATKFDQYIAPRLETGS